MKEFLTETVRPDMFTIPEDLLIYKCYEEHVKDIGGHEEITFSFSHYYNFWTRHKVGAEYLMVNRDKSLVKCKVAYYPLPYYKDLRALIEIDKGMWTDFREVPVTFLHKQ